MGQNVYYRFGESSEYIELKLNEKQEEPFTGWKIKPHMKPCRVSNIVGLKVT